MLFILINDKEKDVSSRDGMRRTVETSSYYSGWLESTPHDLKKLKQAHPPEKDFQLLGETTEANALKMHATTMAATPPFTYWSPRILASNGLRPFLASKKGWPATFTMDAGPNVKVL